VLTFAALHLPFAVFIRTLLKNRILVQDRGGAEFKTGGILLYVEDFKRGPNPAKGGRPKGIFEIDSSKNLRATSEKSTRAGQKSNMPGR
jgi:hypothetical protein